MSVKTTKKIEVFDQAWCPVGTYVQVTQIDQWRYAGSGCTDKPFVGIVVGYKCEDTVMVVKRDGICTEIYIRTVGDKYEIKRLIPESNDTIDMDYESLMNEVDG